MPKPHRPPEPEPADPRTRHIFARMLDGRSLKDIAEAEGLSVRRVQQIVAQEIQRRECNPADDYALLQIARLERALDLLGAEIDAGKTVAVAPFIKVIGELDKLSSKRLYLSRGYREAGETEAMRERFERLTAAREIVEERRAARATAKSEKPNDAQAPETMENREIDDFAAQ